MRYEPQVNSVSARYRMGQSEIWAQQTVQSMQSLDGLEQRLNPEKFCLLARK